MALGYSSPCRLTQPEIQLPEKALCLPFPPLHPPALPQASGQVWVGGLEAQGGVLRESDLSGPFVFLTDATGQEVLPSVPSNSHLLQPLCLISPSEGTLSNQSPHLPKTVLCCLKVTRGISFPAVTAEGSHPLKQGKPSVLSARPLSRLNPPNVRV